MEDNPYKKVDRATASVPLSDTGFYQEYIVVNSSDSPIGMVDKFNNRHLIYPDTGFGKTGTIKVYLRTDTGNKGQNGQLKPMPTTICMIATADLLSDIVYVKEIDVVFCTEKNLQYTDHPQKSLSYEDALKNILEELKSLDSIKVPTIKIVANDPTGKIKKVYCYILDYFVEITPTHYPMSDNGVTIIFPNDGMKTKYISFEEIEKSNGIVSNNQLRCYIGLNKTVIRNAVDLDNSSKKVYTEQEFAEAQKKNDTELAAAIKKAEAIYANKYKVVIQDLNNQITELKTEIDGYKRVLNSADGYLNFVGKTMNHEEKVLQNKSEQMKFWSGTIKIVVPLVIGVLTGKLLMS